MRTQWCREHIDKTAEACGLDRSTVSDVKQAAKFCDDHSEFSECSTHAIMTLIRVRDEPVKEKATSSVENAFKSGKHPLTGKILKEKKLTEREVKAVIARADLEVRKELSAKLQIGRAASHLASAPVDPAPAISKGEHTPRVDQPRATAPIVVAATTTFSVLVTGLQQQILQKAIAAEMAVDMRDAVQMAFNRGIESLRGNA
ncbi:MAG: hypothetical protein WC683_07335 [bacterium]